MRDVSVLRVDAEAKAVHVVQIMSAFFKFAQSIFVLQGIRSRS